MNIQMLVVLLVVGTAATFVVRRAWVAIAAARKPKSGCGSDCGCG